MDFMELLSAKDEDPIYAAVMKSCLADRKIVINEIVGDAILEDVILHILRFNKEDEGLPVEKRKPIKLYINSVGGDVYSGFSLCDTIAASKTPVIGVCFGLAASMAYAIFICCHDRVAFPHSVLLQHDGSIGLQNSSSKAKQTMKFLDEMDDRMKVHVMNFTNMDESFYDEINDQEYYMYANGKGKELGCVDKIIGEDCDIEYIL